MKTLRASLATLFVLALAGGPPAALAQGGCLSGGEGRQLVEQGQVIPFPQAARQAGLTADQVVDVQLCRSGSGYVYRVRVLEAGGRVSSMEIPAG